MKKKPSYQIRYDEKHDSLDVRFTNPKDPRHNLEDEDLPVYVHQDPKTGQIRTLRVLGFRVTCRFLGKKLRRLLKKYDVELPPSLLLAAETAPLPT